MKYGLPGYSVVVPVYNNEKTLEALYTRLCDLFDRELQESVEFIFVDDGSSDCSYEVLEGLNRLDPRVGVIRMKNNVGQHQATLQGLLCCRAEERITIDADLQTDPREILKLLSASKSSVDVVIGPYMQK
jgi:glycosyltransferase involved in cell wall biosynthesis